MVLMNRAEPSDFSYVRSDNSGTSILAEPDDRVVVEKPCPMSPMTSLSPTVTWRGYARLHRSTVGAGEEQLW